jgi:hypothetical protein
MRPARLFAPPANRAILAVPPLADVPSLLNENESCFRRSSPALFAIPLGELRRQARIEVSRRVELPLDWPLIVTGHQPEMFHPGVWIKSAAASAVARRVGGASLNLSVDNDAPKRLAVRVPLRSHDGLSTREVSFDAAPTASVPYEELRVNDEAAFASFADRVMQTSGDLLPEAILPAFWQDVTAAAGGQPLLWPRLVAARIRWERRWGFGNLELPVSALCGGDAFACFAAHLLAELRRFGQVHNEALAGYRRANRIRSATHPVPALQQLGDWLEAPFWVWSAADAHRSRLFARRRGSDVELRRGDAPFAALPCDSADKTIAAWKALADAGFKIRPRALTTTLFARLFLADVFIHGIGGAVYDELTDEIMRRFYSMEPPRFVVVSATLRLPLPQPAPTPSLAELTRARRDQMWKPERFLDAAADPGFQALVAEKRRWIGEAPATRSARRERFRKLRELTEELRACVSADTRTTLQADLAAAEARAESHAVAANREFPFVLHSERELRGLLEGVI